MCKSWKVNGASEKDRFTHAEQLQMMREEDYEVGQKDEEQ
jgi:hypothetical protein